MIAWRVRSTTWTLKWAIPSAFDLACALLILSCEFGVRFLRCQCLACSYRMDAADQSKFAPNRAFKSMICKQMEESSRALHLSTWRLDNEPQVQLQHVTFESISAHSFVVSCKEIDKTLRSSLPQGGSL